MAVHVPRTKREVSVENKNTSDAQHAAAPPKAKAKVKAKAQPKKANAIIIQPKFHLEDNQFSEDDGGSDSSQAR